MQGVKDLPIIQSEKYRKGFLDEDNKLDGMLCVFGVVDG